MTPLYIFCYNIYVLAVSFMKPSKHIWRGKVVNLLAHIMLLLVIIYATYVKSKLKTCVAYMLTEFAYMLRKAAHICYHNSKISYIEGRSRAIGPGAARSGRPKLRPW